MPTLNESIPFLLLLMVVASPPPWCSNPAPAAVSAVNGHVSIAGAGLRAGCHDPLSSTSNARQVSAFRCPAAAKRSPTISPDDPRMPPELVDGLLRYLDATASPLHLRFRAVLPKSQFGRGLRQCHQHRRCIEAAVLVVFSRSDHFIGPLPT